ncbi:MAG: hypothetical protein JRH11_09250 [Deltaproteobacteria bacterium]|nr:hypothetical protein [Deltaproteobacteria bacterium]
MRRGGLLLVTCLAASLLANPVAAQEGASQDGAPNADRAGDAERTGGIDNHPPPPFGSAPLGGGVVLSPGWSVEAFWIGIGAAAGVVGTGVAAVALASTTDTADGAVTALGITAMALLGVGTAVVALGGASARGHPYVPGARGLRIAAWTLGSLSLGTGIALVASDIAADDARAAAFVAPVVLGAVSLILFAIDAVVSAIQTDIVSRGGG